MKKMIVLALLLALAAPAAGLAQGGDLSFNNASAEEITEALAGLVDAELARAIVAYRLSNGAFQEPEDLLKVEGMSRVIFSSIRPEKRDGDIIFVDDIPTGMHSY